MITLYRPAYYRIHRAPRYAGLSTDVKPLNVPNGAQYVEIDTGGVYSFDASTGTWHGGIVSTWEYPVQDGDVLKITQVYSATQNGSILSIE